MDTKEAERVVVAKPVASRPTSSKFKSFSELLAGAIDAPPQQSCSETVVAAIKPKTVRFKPMVNRSQSALVSYQAQVSVGAAASDPADKNSKPDARPAVIYKPQAKLASKTTVSLLANMGNFDIMQQPMATSTGVSNQQNDQDKHTFMPQLTSTLHGNTRSLADADQTTEPSRLTSENHEDDPKTLTSMANGDRPSYDGYNWRKYGQKQVKGSEYPRSYYKCTHPNCPVKKKVERSLDGEIVEIVYRGEHNHPKPQPLKRNMGAPGLVASDGTSDQDASDAPLWTSHVNERDDGSKSRSETLHDKGVPIFSTLQDKVPGSSDDVGVKPDSNAGFGTSENSAGLSGECDAGSKGLEGDIDEARNKRRKSENQLNEAGMSGEGLQDPRLVVQSPTDTASMGDGYRWRKYGQKVVKGNPYPRSYYRCTGLKCNVRKHVERVSDNPEAFITTYEGKHNHKMPARTTTNLNPNT